MKDDIQYKDIKYGRPGRTPNVWVNALLPNTWLDPTEHSGWIFTHMPTGEEVHLEDFLEICRREAEKDKEGSFVPCTEEQMRDPNWIAEQIPNKRYGLEEHPSGALRESKAGKGRPDLFLAGFPRAIMAVCRHMDCKLGLERNWEKGLPESSLISSQFRHLLGYASGVSEDSPEYNLTANVWNALVLLEEYLRVQDGVMDESVLDVEKPNE